MMKEESILKYEIKGNPSFAHVAITLEKPGDEIVAEGGAMIYMDGHIQMTTKSSGGIMKGLKRKLSGESMFQNYFSIPEGTEPGTVIFSHGVPGDIVHLHLKQGEQWVLSRDGYICSTTGIAVSTTASGRQWIGGEGLFQTTVTAQETEGDVWFGGYGMVEKHEIAPGKEFVVDTSIMMAYSANMEHKISKVGGRKSFILGGEGFVIRYTGPGTVYTQNRDIKALAALIIPFIPKSQ